MARRLAIGGSGKSKGDNRRVRLWEPQDPRRRRRGCNHTTNIYVVRDGAEALEFLFCTGAYANRSISNGPKIILLDLNLPLVDGLEVLRRIKADERTQAIPVVVLTSSREARDTAESYRLGANSYIVKPLEFEQFADAVRDLGLY